MRVLVCGTNYGRLYLEAIRLGRADFHLAGILARGSFRSQLTALEYGVPLFRGVMEVDQDVDLACAAMGASGSDVVLGLLAHRIHVLCEHPQKPRCLELALDRAASRGLCFHINGHFADLEAAATFIRRAREVCTAEPPSFFQVTATDRSLYAALDILGRVLVSLAPLHFQVTSQFAQFIVLEGVLGGVPATFHVQRRANDAPLPDGSPGYLVDHRIAAGFPTGILTLLSMNGPVIWNANLNCGKEAAEPLLTVLHADRLLTPERLHQQRIAANLSAIVALVNSIRERAVPRHQHPDYLLDVSRAWETLGRLL
jgi:thiazolinyl imide reductase